MQFLAAQTLGAQQDAEFGADGADQFGEGGAGCDGEPQRQVVGEHGRGGERGRGAARGHRDAEDHVVDGEHPVVVDGGGRGDNGRPVADGGERAGQLGRQDGAQTQGAR